jgi:ABC-type lipoprotein release transport system permease subunit
VAGAVATGRWLDAREPKGVVVGRRLARTLSVAPGDELVVLSQAADGSLANDLFTVRGVLKGIADGVDRSAVFMTEETFRELMVFPRGAHQVIARRPAGTALDVAAVTVREAAPGLDVRTWRELLPTVALMFDSARGMITIVVLVVYLAVGILVLNAMLMAVFERIREFGVIKALGVGPGGVFRLILTESFLQAGLAMLAGLVLSLPAMWYLAKYGIDTGKMGGMAVMGLAVDPVWYGVYRPDTVALPVVMLVVVVAIAVLYPALKAAWIRPVKAMHHR